MKLSISIVNYKNEDDIRELIPSIMEHTTAVSDKVIYIVNNNGAASAELEAIEASYDEVVVVNSPRGNVGFGAGHNEVLERLDSEYHAIVNPDILFTEDVCGPLMEYLETHPDVGMVVPEIMDDEGKRLAVYRRYPTIMDCFLRRFLEPFAFAKKRDAYHTLQDMDYTKDFQVPFAQGSFLMIRTELYKALGGFDDRYFLYMEDADLCRQVNEVSKLMYVPNVHVTHHWARGSKSNRKLLMIHIKSMIAYFCKWGWKFR